ncbi:hypothetical protein B1812_04135 [Methylocystis bryophila]|uniref:Uncharacterized protein n=2 Tax=Methylocystis bryophila TaxID=655015 RepID=A0A1W6MS71_9HYPH|nr:hypothetical protein B1812_04135 [Methylocystis bryophila]
MLGAFMTMRGLMIGIAVWLPAMVFVSVGWGQSKPNRVKPSYVPPYDATYVPSYDATYYPDYGPEIRKSLERLNPPERFVIESILAELATKSREEIFRLKLETDEVCQEIDCRGASPIRVGHYIEAYAEQRATDDARQNALRNAGAAERSAAAAESNKQIAEVALGFSFLSLLISFLTFWRASSGAKSVR